MQLVLPPEVEALVQQQLNSGNYSSPADVVLAAMQLLQHQEEKKLQELRQAVQIGLEDSKQGRTIDGSTAIAQIRDRLRDLKKERNV